MVLQKTRTRPRYADIYILDTESDKFERLVKEMCWIEIMQTSDPNKGMTKFTC